MPFDPPRVTDVVSVSPSGGDDTQYLRDAIAYCFGPPTAPHGGGLGSCANRTLYFSPGKYRITDTLDLTGLQGARIVGAGRLSVRIEQETEGKGVFRTNGCQYSVFDGILLRVGAGGVCFDLDYDGAGSYSVALQSNTFRDMMFLGGDYGIRIGHSLHMGSENLIQNCAFEGHAAAGLTTQGYNALQQTVIGGNFQGCGIGIFAEYGAVPIIHGVGFQQNGVDIKTHNGVEAYSVAGCRSESANFIDTVQRMVVSGCLHYSAAGPGTFLKNYANQVTIRGCVSTEGLVRAENVPHMRIAESTFGRNDWLSLDINDGANIELENVQHGGLYSDQAQVTHIKRRRIYGTGVGQYATADYAMVAS